MKSDNTDRLLHKELGDWSYVPISRTKSSTMYSSTVPCTGVEKDVVGLRDGELSGLLFRNEMKENRRKRRGSDIAFFEFRTRMHKREDKKKREKERDLTEKRSNRGFLY